MKTKKGHPAFWLDLWNEIKNWQYIVQNRNELAFKLLEISPNVEMTAQESSFCKQHVIWNEQSAIIVIYANFFAAEKKYN